MENAGNIDLIVHIGSEKWHQAAAYFVRMKVFVLERDIAIQDEFDSEDHDEAVYVVLYDNDKPVATGRFIQMDEGTVRPGRIAVLNDYRGKGLGERVVKELEAYARTRGCKTSEIHGEMSAAPFYEKLGYTREGETYLEDGVPCITLKKVLI